MYFTHVSLLLCHYQMERQLQDIWEIAEGMYVPNQPLQLHIYILYILFYLFIF